MMVPERFNPSVMITASGQSWLPWGKDQEMLRAVKVCWILKDPGSSGRSHAAFSVAQEKRLISDFVIRYNLIGACWGLVLHFSSSITFQVDKNRSEKATLRGFVVLLHQYGGASGEDGTAGEFLERNLFLLRQLIMSWYLLSQNVASYSSSLCQPMPSWHRWIVNLSRLSKWFAVWTGSFLFAQIFSES